MAPSRSPVAGLALALLLGVLSGCQADDVVASAGVSPLPVPWVTITEGGLFESESTFRVDGGGAVRSELPEEDPFAQREADEARRVEEFLGRWEGPDELLFEPQGFRKTPLRVPVSRLFLHVAPSGDRALLLASRNMLLVLPDTAEELPPVEEAAYLAPARWHPSGSLVAVGSAPRERSQGPAGAVVLIDTAAGRVQRTLPIEEGWWLRDLSWHPDGRSLALLTWRRGEVDGLLDQVSDVVYGGAHGPTSRDLRLEVHPIDGSAPRVVPLAEDVGESSRERVLWLAPPTSDR